MDRQFARCAELDREKVSFTLDGVSVTALEGDSLLVAILSNTKHLRISEFGDGKRAGFCLMGVCQDCWVWTASGQRLRACTTVVDSGMDVVTAPEVDAWLSP